MKEIVIAIPDSMRVEIDRQDGRVEIRVTQDAAVDRAEEIRRLAMSGLEAYPDEMPEPRS